MAIPTSMPFVPPPEKPASTTAPPARPTGPVIPATASDDLLLAHAIEVLAPHVHAHVQVYDESTLQGHLTNGLMARMDPGAEAGTVGLPQGWAAQSMARRAFALLFQPREPMPVFEHGAPVHTLRGPVVGPARVTEFGRWLLEGGYTVAMAEEAAAKVAEAAVAKAKGAAKAKTEGAKAVKTATSQDDGAPTGEPVAKQQGS